MQSKHYVLFLSITAALGGFLFGFDTAVISGAERDIQALWGLSDLSHGLAVAMALYGTVLGALFGGIPADRFGRKTSLIWIGLLYLVSALGSAFAPEVYSFMVFRFIGGLGVGASSVVAPMYISEIAPAKRRGQLVALYQFNIVFGILMAYFSNYLIGTANLAEAWRWMLGVEAIPALIYSILIIKVPKSPRWLITKKQDFEGARAILTKTDPEGVDEAITLAIAESKEIRGKMGFGTLFTPRFKKISGFAVLMAFFNQMSGINAIIYFAPRIFESAGISTENALLSTIGIGAINIVATMLGLYLIDRIGRKKLMYIGSVGYIISLSLMAYSYFGGFISSSLLPFFVFGFIASHAIGQGSVIWVFIAEIFPNELRAFGQSMGSFTHWILAAVIANIFPFVANSFGAGNIFAFFALMMVLQLLWVAFKMPETKGRSLEEIQKDLQKSHV
ncbi:MFS transporter [Rhodonellum psychrophilum GCM71 = DSM 17998]|uniref:MFS transporter n=2 Tax=Rhodonellum TaxID=336827 RepID=U5BV91_9BACT|nr:MULTISPECIES: sugar porter family MFS transporter [Rhodonellum]ERM84570.1 MFS transporter [Rhodonellum psychrophilum GCM71 = DSM 17998]MDO9554839.1 sugar porter family MFS transporter [Rhodonellum sp.]SDY85449.1 MFS transporter, sugar porter (SP) family [Rhodonellum ikkaensis]